MRIAILVEEKGWRKVLQEAVTRLETEGHDVEIYKVVDVDEVIPFYVNDASLNGTDEDDEKRPKSWLEGD